MKFGGELTIGNVTDAWKEEKTGLIGFQARCGKEELVIKLSPADFNKLRGLQPQSRKNCNGKDFHVWIGVDDAILEKPTLAEGFIFLGLTDHSGKRSFELDMDFDMAKRLQEKLGHFVNLHASLLALDADLP